MLLGTLLLFLTYSKSILGNVCYLTEVKPLASGWFNIRI